MISKINFSIFLFFFFPIFLFGTFQIGKDVLDHSPEQYYDQKSKVLYFVLNVEVIKGYHLNSHTPLNDFLIPTTLSFLDEEGNVLEPISIHYPKAKQIVIDGEKVEWYHGSFQIAAKINLENHIEKLTSKSIPKLTYRFSYQPCNDSICYAPQSEKSNIDLLDNSKKNRWVKDTFNPLVEKIEQRPLIHSENLSEIAFQWSSFFLFLLLAFLGGILINFMPCVFPILFLKIFSLGHLVQEKKSKSVYVFSYCLGILSCFLALGFFIGVVKYFGSELGWGFQFQNIHFVFLMAVVLLLISLYFWGFYSWSGFGFLKNLNQNKNTPNKKFLTKKYFLEGVLVTLFSTACSAPFLGAASGFALTQNFLVILIFFLVIGLGFICPFLLLAFFPRLEKLFPKPGDWLTTFYRFFGYVFFAVFVWVVSILYYLSSWAFLYRTFYFFLFLVFLIYLMQIFSKKIKQKIEFILVCSVVVALLVGVYVTKLLPYRDEIDFQNTIEMMYQNKSEFMDTESAKKINWMPFTPESAEYYLESDSIVFIDFTAKWCLNCQFNKKRVLQNPKIIKLFQDYNVVALSADWTRRNPFIEKYLKKFNRQAIPLNVIYPADKDKEAIILKEILTVSEVTSGIVEASESSD